MSHTVAVQQDKESPLSRRNALSLLGLVATSLVVGSTAAKAAAPGPLFIQGGDLIPDSARLSGDYVRQNGPICKAIALATREIKGTMSTRLASVQLAVWAEADTNTGRTGVDNDDAVGIIQYNRDRIAEGYFADFGLTSVDQALDEETAFIVAAKRMKDLLKCSVSESPVVNRASIEVLQRLSTSAGEAAFKNAFNRLTDQGMIVGARALAVDRSTSLDCPPLE